MLLAMVTSLLMVLALMLPGLGLGLQLQRAVHSMQTRHCLLHLRNSART